MVAILLYITAVVLTSYGVDLLLSFVLESKYKRIVNVDLYTILYLSYAIIMDYFIKSLPVKYISLYVFIALFIYLVYKGSIIRKIIAYFEFLTVVLFSELITTQIICGELGYSVEEVFKNSVFRSIVNIACAIVQLLIVLIFIFLQKKIRFVLSLSKVILFMCVFLSQALVATLYNFLFVKYTDGANIVFIVYLFITLLLGLWLLRCMTLLEIKEDTEEKIKNFEKETELIAEYYSELSENINNLESIKNEYNYELKNIYEITGKISEFDKAKDDDKNKKSKEEMTSNKSNVLVNNIISNVKAQLDLLNAPYKIDVDVTENINMDYGDLSSLLINMFVNAIEAVEIYVNELKEGKPVKNKENYFLEGIVNADEKEIKIEIKNIK
ncbi:MAG: hypothetical protein IJA34_03940, partial [Lachnospiraceae bacterium]|nr:hypothetical protein [Lachnospiraceae bacterium]